MKIRTCQKKSLKAVNMKFASCALLTLTLHLSSDACLLHQKCLFSANHHHHLKNTQTLPSSASAC